MATTAAERKATEKLRNEEKGLFRRSFWLSQDSLNLLQSVKDQYSFKTNDQALDHILKSFPLITKNP